MTRSSSSATSISILVNGEEAAAKTGETVLDFLGNLGRHPRTVAIEYNGEILPRVEYGETVLAGGDRLEIVGFVQCG